MIRTARAIHVLALSAVLLTPAASATAAPPTHVDPAPELYTADEACSFPISVTAEGKAGSIDLPNNPRFVAITPSPGLKVTVTNLDDTTKTVRVNATGAFRYSVLPDGGTEIRAGGHNLWYGLPEIGGTALATSGPVTVIISPDGVPTVLDVSRARVRDLCAELA